METLKIIGIIIIILSTIFVFVCTYRKKIEFLQCLWLWLISVFIGFVLILSDRIIEISINRVGTIKAAADQAKIDAQAINQIKQRIENQSATIDLVAKTASEYKRLFEDLSKKNEAATDKLKIIDTDIKKSNESLTKLSASSDFYITAISAQNDSRKDWDKLGSWANDKKHPLSKLAKAAWLEIYEKHCQPFFQSGYKLPWISNIDPSKLSLNEIKNIYKSSQSPFRPALIEFVWKQDGIGKKDKMSFFIEVMKSDESLRAVEYAGRYFCIAAKLNLKPMAIDNMLKWWDKNKNNI